MSKESKKEYGEIGDKPGWIEPQVLKLEKLEGKEILIRNSRPEDYQVLANIVQDRWDYRTREWGSEKRDINKTPKAMEFLEKSISDPEKLTVFMMTVDNEPAGYIEFGQAEEGRPSLPIGVIKIHTLSVLEKYRGTGVGYSLLKYAEDTAQNVFGAKEIRLRTHSCNEDALRLYRRSGYKESETEEREDAGFEVKGEQVYMIPLSKSLEQKK
jgi:ribosomal protein S18 acetylase RimI-like enzyme